MLANKLTTAANTIFLQSTGTGLHPPAGSAAAAASRSRGRDLGFMLVIGDRHAALLRRAAGALATAPDPVRGNILALLSGFTCAADAVGLRWMGKTRGLARRGRGGLGNLFAFLAALPLVLPLGPHGADDWIVIVYLGVFQIAPGLRACSPGAIQPRARASRSRCSSSSSRRSIRSGPGWSTARRRGPGRWLGGALIMGATAVKAWWDRRR